MVSDINTDLVLIHSDGSTRIMKPILLNYTSKPSKESRIWVLNKLPGFKVMTLTTPQEISSKLLEMERQLSGVSTFRLFQKKKLWIIDSTFSISLKSSCKKIIHWFMLETWLWTEIHRTTLLKLSKLALVLETLSLECKLVLIKCFKEDFSLILTH